MSYPACNEYWREASEFNGAGLASVLLAAEARGYHAVNLVCGLDVFLVRDDMFCDERPDHSVLLRSEGWFDCTGVTDVAPNGTEEELLVDMLDILSR